MKTNNSKIKRNHRPILKTVLIILGLVLLAGGIFACLEYTKVINIFKTPADLAAEQQQALSSEASAQKQKYIEAAKKVKDEDDDADSNDQNPVGNTNIAISATKEGNSVTIITKLTGYSDGDCKLVITNGDTTETQYVKVIYQPEFSTCAGFSIPISKLGSGTWLIELNVTTLSGQTGTQNARIEVAS